MSPPYPVRKCLMMNPRHWLTAQFLFVSETVAYAPLTVVPLVVVPLSNTNPGWPSTKWPCPSVSFMSHRLSPFAHPQVASLAFPVNRQRRVHVVIRRASAERVVMPDARA